MWLSGYSCLFLIIRTIDNLYSSLIIATEGLWKTRALGKRYAGIPAFKTPTLNKETLWAEESMRDGYHPKMLLYTLDKLFYIYAKVKNSQRGDKVIQSYEILCISANQCTNWWNRIKKTSMPDALALLNVEDNNILSASCGQCMMAHCWWAHGPNFWVITLGAQCWLGCSDTSTGATMMQPIAHHRC